MSDQMGLGLELTMEQQASAAILRREMEVTDFALAKPYIIDEVIKLYGMYASTKNALVKCYDREIRTQVQAAGITKDGYSNPGRQQETTGQGDVSAG